MVDCFGANVSSDVNPKSRALVFFNEGLSIDEWMSKCQSLNFSSILFEFEDTIRAARCA